MSVDEPRFAAMAALAKATNWDDWRPSGQPAQLSPQEVFKCVWAASGMIGNGGFFEFFYASTGDRTSDILQAFQRIGMARAAELLHEAQRLLFNGEAPTTEEDRQRLLDELCSGSDDECREVHASQPFGRIRELEDAFFAVSDQMNEKLYNFLAQASLLAAPESGN